MTREEYNEMTAKLWEELKNVTDDVKPLEFETYDDFFVNVLGDEYEEYLIKQLSGILTEQERAKDWIFEVIQKVRQDDDGNEQ